MTGADLEGGQNAEPLTGEITAMASSQERNDANLARTPAKGIGARRPWQPLLPDDAPALARRRGGRADPLRTAGAVQRAQAASDPYEAWRARREAERERSQVEAVRWVYRQRGTAAAPADGNAAAAEAVRWVNRYRGIGAAPGREGTSGARAAELGSGHERPADLVGAQGG